MKLVGQELGRVIVLFPMEEIRPLSGVSPLPLFEEVKNRYSFIKTPDLSKSFLELDQQGYLFEAGSLSYRGQLISIRDFTIYRDGVSISCFDTSHAEAFFEDILRLVKQNFGFREFIRGPKKIYRSQIVVEFEHSLNKIISGFSEISSLIQQAYHQYTGHDSEININRIDFQMDTMKIRGVAPIAFILERRIGAPHETERYISDAPLSSSAHVQLLQSIEEKVR